MTSRPPSGDEPTIFSIGHGRHGWREFLALLREFDIDFVCDIRNFARSRWPQFNGLVLAANLADEDIGYEHLPECGGKIVAADHILSAGVDRMIELASEMNVVMMCSESQPLTAHKLPRANCHRVGLLPPLLYKRGIKRIIHILPNGTSTVFDETVVPSIW